MLNFNVAHFFIASVFYGLAFALPTNNLSAHHEISGRSADACADPTFFAWPYSQGYTLGVFVHRVKMRHQFENDNVISRGLLYVDIHPVFNAFVVAQDFVLPLWELSTPAGDQFTYRIGTGVNGTTPPSLPGFTKATISGYAYANQTCGSVPLYTMVLHGSSFTDRIVTTDEVEREGLIDDGWSLEGVFAYVFPPST